MQDFQVAVTERHVISAALGDWRIVPGIELEPRDFVTPQASRIWETMRTMAADGGWRGLNELSARAGRDEEHARALRSWLAECPVVGLSAVDAQNAAALVRRHAVTRSAIAIGDEISRLRARGFTGDDLVAGAIAYLSELRSRIARKRTQDGGELAARLMRLASGDAREGDDAGLARYVPIGLPTLDRACGGFQGGVLTALLAKTSMGKSSFIKQCALHAARNGFPAHWLSAEDLETDTGWRLVSEISDIPASELRRYRSLTDRQKSQLVSALDKLEPLQHVRLTPITGMSADQVVAQVRLHQERDKTAIVFVDYLQRLRQEPNEKRYETLTKALEVFDSAAKADGLPWVIGTQLKRTDSEYPQLSDCRDAGTIEEYVKGAIGLHRPGKGTGNDTRMWIGILKSSNDDTSEDWFEWDGPMMRILDRYPRGAM